MNIPFNKPHLTGKEAHYMYQAVFDGKLSGNGEFTKRCQHFMEQKYGFRKCLLTTSCTDALEMAALLCELHPGDEVIVPSYTFVSSALAFVREGAKIVFADSMKRKPGISLRFCLLSFQMMSVAPSTPSATLRVSPVAQS